MRFVERCPEHEDLLDEAGLVHVDEFLTCVGESVQHRPNRQVHRIHLGGAREAYLKTDRRVPFRDRWMSWRHGYGAVSKSVREGRVLRQLEAAGVGCPHVLALGEDDGEAFVLLNGEPDLAPLDRYLIDRPRERDAVLSLLGVELARMHVAGFFHPDLYPKHVLVGRSDGLYRFCILDWQRSVRLARVSWSRRILDLAVMEAALPSELIGEPDRFGLLLGYLDATPGDRPALGRIAEAIKTRGQLLLWHRRVARQRAACRVAFLAEQAARSRHRHNRHIALDRLASASFSALPLVNFLRPRADLHLRRRLLRLAGRYLRELHETGYEVRETRLEDWRVERVDDGDGGEILPARIAEFRPTSADPEDIAPAELRALERQTVRRLGGLSRTDRVRFLSGYLAGEGNETPTSAELRDLVSRILAEREPAG
jgi:tRNA A-37 threonylcarbamoyl transferase component Bud32